MAPADGMTADDAFALLGLDGLASPEAVATAFKSKIKAARPDQEAGDPDLFRRTIEAYHLLQKLNAARSAMKAGLARAEAKETLLNISINEAMVGVRRRIRLPDGSRAPMSLPAGLRTDDIIRIKQKGSNGTDLLLKVRVGAEPQREIQGHDLWMSVEVDSRVLALGGRFQVNTPSGERTVWAPRAFPKDGKLRLRGQGLPARGDHPAGDLYLRLKPIHVPRPQEAKTRLNRFQETWAQPQAGL